MEYTKSKKNLGERYRELLGISVGSAAHKLTRILLFKYVQQNHDDVCYRCGKKIETIETFSLEHKVPWLHSDPKLFWDLNNIAFAHRTCNTLAARHEGKRVVGPVGTSWCSGHKEFFPTAAFNKNRSMWNGFHRQCKECCKDRKKRSKKM